MVTNCHHLKLSTQDGKNRLTDVANVETIFRLIQSVPSPKAEPIKLWLARVGHERIQELADPEQSINRARENWQKMGRSKKWVQERMINQETQHELTDYWKNNGVKAGQEYAALTNIIHKEWTGETVSSHKSLKGLDKQNLRDHMSEAEFVFTAFAELSTRKIAESMCASGFEENKEAAQKGGEIAKHARKELELKTGKSVITDENFFDPGF